LIIRLKENNDEVDVINIAERIKELQEKLPDLESKEIRE